MTTRSSNPAPTRPAPQGIPISAWSTAPKTRLELMREARAIAMATGRVIKAF